MLSKTVDENLWYGSSQTLVLVLVLAHENLYGTVIPHNFSLQLPPDIQGILVRYLGGWATTVIPYPLSISPQKCWGASLMWVGVMSGVWLITEGERESPPPHTSGLTWHCMIWLRINCAIASSITLNSTQYKYRYSRYKRFIHIQVYLWAVFRIRIDFNADPDPGGQTNADQTLPSQKVGFWHKKYILCW